MLVGAVLWLGIASHMRQRAGEAITQAEKDVANLSVALREEIDRTLSGIDQVLRFVADDYRDDPKAFDFQAWVRRADSLRGTTAQIGFADSTGAWLASSLKLPAGQSPIDLSDRTYFRVHAERPDAGTFASSVTAGRMDGKLGFQISRRVENPDGTFAGVVFATVDPASLAQRFGAIDVGPGGTVSLIGRDGYMRARWPARSDIYDQDLSRVPAIEGLFQRVEAGRDGVAQAGSAVDGSERIFGYRGLASLPLVIVVGKSVAEVLAPVERERLRAQALGLFATLLLVVAVWALVLELEAGRRREEATLRSNRALAEAQGATFEANRRLRLAEQVAHVGHWRVIVASGALAWSDGTCRIHGLDAAGARPTVEDAVAFYHPDDREMLKTRLAEATAAAQPFEMSARIVRADGAIRDVLVRGLCERGEDGRAEALFGTIMDVSELRHAEREAAATSALLTATLDSMDQGLMVVSPEGRIAVCSPRTVQLLDLPPDLIARGPTTREVLDYQWTRGEFDAADEPTRQLMRESGYVDGPHSYERTRPDGTVLEIRSRPMARGGVVRTYTDITARRRAELAVSESESRYRDLAETTSDVITRLNLAFAREYVSPSCRTVFGFEPHEMLGQRPSAAAHEDDAPALRELAGRLVAGQIAGDRVLTTYRARHKAGHWVWVEANINLLRDAGGDPASLICSLRDVSERHRQAEELRAAKVAAEAGARTKTEFLANMSHELRTPLTGMLGVHELLRADPSLGTRQRELVDLAQESGRSLLVIVNDVLDVSKMDAGQLAIERVPYDVHELVRGCRQIASESAAGRPIFVEVDISPDLPRRLLGDPTRIRQVLLNLATNAVKFTEAGSVRIGAAGRAGRLEVEITDTGIGIDPAAIPLLFERFSQADGSTARRFGGTGLGLAISKRLVELMGGSITAESRPGRGSTFRFTVPLEVAADEAGRQGEPDRALTAGAVRRRILLAEDNATNRTIVAAVLERLGHRVTVARDGDEAVSAFRSARFDVVLMDVQMPGRDGIAATGEIRAIERAAGLARTPVVALTANASREEAQRCILAGMDAHVGKPVDWQELDATLQRLCRREPPGSVPVPESPPILDEETLATLEEYLGAPKIGRLLIDFRSETERRLGLLAAASVTPAEVAGHAHVLVSLAGQLGFAELSAVCARLEAEAASQDGRAGIDELRSVAARAIRAAAASRYAEAA